MFRRKAKYIDYLAEDETYQDPVEARFEAMMTLVKDLSQKDYRRLKKAMDSGYIAWGIPWQRSLVGYSPWGHKNAGP